MLEECSGPNMFFFSPEPAPSFPSAPPASRRLRVTGEWRMSLLRRSTSFDTVALISIHWQERGTWEENEEARRIQRPQI